MLNSGEVFTFNESSLTTVDNWEKACALAEVLLFKSDCAFKRIASFWLPEELIVFLRVSIDLSSSLRLELIDSFCETRFLTVDAESVFVTWESICKTLKFAAFNAGAFGWNPNELGSFFSLANDKNSKPKSATKLL